MPSVRKHFEDEERYYVQQDGALIHYHSDVRAYLNDICQTDGLGEEVQSTGLRALQTFLILILKLMLPLYTSQIFMQFTFL